MSYPGPICSTCTCQSVSPGNLTIHNERKWLCSPDPCPECMDRLRGNMRALGRNLAERHERAVMNAIFPKGTG